MVWGAMCISAWNSAIRSMHCWCQQNGYCMMWLPQLDWCACYCRQSSSSGSIQWWEMWSKVDVEANTGSVLTILHVYQVKYFIDPYKVITNFKSCPLHTSKSKLDSYEHGVLWKFIHGWNLNGAHASLVDAVAQMDVITSTHFTPYINHRGCQEAVRPGCWTVGSDRHMNGKVVEWIDFYIQGQLI